MWRLHNSSLSRRDIENVMDKGSEIFATSLSAESLEVVLTETSDVHKEGSSKDGGKLPSSPPTASSNLYTQERWTTQGCSLGDDAPNQHHLILGPLSTSVNSLATVNLEDSTMHTAVSPTSESIKTMGMVGFSSGRTKRNESIGSIRPESLEACGNSGEGQYGTCGAFDCNMYRGSRQSYTGTIPSTVDVVGQTNRFSLARNKEASRSDDEGQSNEACEEGQGMEAKCNNRFPRSLILDDVAVESRLKNLVRKPDFLLLKSTSPQSNTRIMISARNAFSLLRPSAEGEVGSRRSSLSSKTRPIKPWRSLASLGGKSTRRCSTGANRRPSEGNVRRFHRTGSSPCEYAAYAHSPGSITHAISSTPGSRHEVDVSSCLDSRSSQKSPSFNKEQARLSLKEPHQGQLVPGIGRDEPGRVRSIGGELGRISPGQESTGNT
ncbi:unnamed protein product, partial [Choristocarpus tenellus]